MLQGSYTKPKDRSGPVWSGLVRSGLVQTLLGSDPLRNTASAEAEQRRKRKEDWICRAAIKRSQEAKEVQMCDKAFGPGASWELEVIKSSQSYRLFSVTHFLLFLLQKHSGAS